MSQKAGPILIVGAGIAGPTLAISLKREGYEVTLFEKYGERAIGGISLNLAPNGLRVLDGLGLTQHLLDRKIVTPIEFGVHANEKEIIATNEEFTLFRKQFGFPYGGVNRRVFLEYLLESARNEGVEIRFNHSLIQIQQMENSVTVLFENGVRVEGSILVGCDGLHSNTRLALFGPEPAKYTGLSQTGGLASLSRRIRHVQNVYGDNVHFIAYPVGIASLDDPASGTHDDMTMIGWACTRRESEAREDWKLEPGDKHRNELLSLNVGENLEKIIGLKELVDASQGINKFGLYDRKSLETWHKGRVILIGDAAHPTAPHLGQGGNQALEDVWFLTAFLKKYIPPRSFTVEDTPSLEILQKVFEEFEALRIPRTTTLVQGARLTGSRRVLPASSPEAAERDARLKEEAQLSDEEKIHKFSFLLSPPNIQQ